MKIFMLSLIDPELNDAGKVHFLELAYSFSKIGHEVSCVLPKGNPGKRFKDKIRFYTLPMGINENYLYILLMNILQFFWVFWYIKKDISFIYIRFRLIPCFFLKILLKLKGLNPVIFTEHPGWVEREMQIEGQSGWKVRIGSFLQVMDAKYADMVLAMTEGTQEKHLENGLNRKKINILQNGTNIEHYYPLETSVIEKFRREVLTIPENSLVFGFSGNISKWQGIEDLIKASATLMKDFPIYLLIIGSGKYLEEIKQTIEQQNMGARIILKENIPYAEMNLWNNCIDVAFAPKVKSLDGFTSPLKIRDYAACGKPVISTAIRGIKEFEPYGWLITYELNKPNDLEDKMRMILKDKAYLSEMGKKGRIFAEQYFSWDKVAQTTIDIYLKRAEYE